MKPTVTCLFVSIIDTAATIDIERILFQAVCILNSTVLQPILVGIYEQRQNQSN